MSVCQIKDRVAQLSEIGRGEVEGRKLLRVIIDEHGMREQKRHDHRLSHRQRGPGPECEALAEAGAGHNRR